MADVLEVIFRSAWTYAGFTFWIVLIVELFVVASKNRSERINESDSEE